MEDSEAHWIWPIENLTEVLTHADVKHLGALPYVFLAAGKIGRGGSWGGREGAARACRGL